jgi:hypothetical protein
VEPSSEATMVPLYRSSWALYSKKATTMATMASAATAGGHLYVEAPAGCLRNDLAAAGTNQRVVTRVSGGYPGRG